jgi:transposase
VQNCIKAAKEKNVTWSMAENLDDKTLKETLFAPTVVAESKFEEPDWNWVYTELKRRGVNRRLLWLEYISGSAGKGLSYSQFNRRFKIWLKRQELSMRQEHKAGDKLFVDCVGHTMPVVVDRETGVVEMAQIFVAVLGASNYSYVDASWSQDLHSWINSHVRALEFMKGVPQCLVPDNLKSGVTKADAFDPFVNKTYQSLARHYQCAIRPARKVHPKDKAKVEKGVQFAETWILARLRNYTFFSLAQLNETIQQLLIELNNEPFQKLPGTRSSQFLAIDLPALRPLPRSPFELEEWLTKIKIEKDYHVIVDEHYYSVPHQLRGERVDIRYTDHIVEIFHNNVRVTGHPRNRIRHGTTTLDEHRPPQHAVYAGMSPEKFLHQAKEIGTFTHQVILAVIQAHPYPQLALDKCFGILSSLRGKYGNTKLEAAAEYAIRIGSPSYRIMKAALEAKDLPQQMTIAMIDSHKNIRGPEEYKQQGERTC